MKTPPKDKRCTKKQESTLRKYGINTKNVNMDRASELINKIAANNWELPNELKGSFVTTVRSAVTQGELIPQYDVEYVAETKVGQVRVAAKNWRRNVTVEVQGATDAIKAAYVQMVLAGLKAD